MRARFAEAALWILLAGLAVEAPRMGLAGTAAFGVLVGLALVLQNRPVPGKLAVRHLPFLLALFVLLGSAGSNWIGEWRALWLCLPAGGLFVAGHLGLDRDARRARRSWVTAGAVTLLASCLVGGGARATVVLRSGLPIPPGSLAFLAVMAVCAALWFGLDAFLRMQPPNQRPGPFGWLSDRRHVLGLLAVEIVILLRTGLA